MSIYFVDYENTKNLNGISKLTDKDEVFVFYTKNSNSLTFEIHREINTSHAKISLIKVEAGGKNALDFQLASYLGYLVKENEDTEKNSKYFIMSKDKGFLSVQSFWTSKNIDIKIIYDFLGEETLEKSTDAAKENDFYTAKETQSVQQEPIKSETQQNDIKSTLDNSPLQLTKEDKKAVIDMVSKYKTKQSINNALMKHFKKSEKVGEITKIIKPFLKSKK